MSILPLPRAVVSWSKSIFEAATITIFPFVPVVMPPTAVANAPLSVIVTSPVFVETAERVAASV